MAPSDPFRRARRAYELARVRAGVRAAWPLLGIAPMAIALRGTALVVPTLAAAAGLGLLVVVLVWRGGALARGVGLGFIAGLPPLLAPALWALARGSCGGECDIAAMGLAGEMWSECLLTCGVAGLASGALVGWRSAGVPRSGSHALSAALVAGATGALGCALIGLVGVLGIFIGLAVGAAPVLLARSARASS